MFQRFILFILVVLFLASCTKTRYVYRDAASTDTLHTSSLRVVERVDSVVVRDSVYITEKVSGDTIRITELRWRDRWRTSISRDTLRDTIYQSRTDTIRVAEKVEAAKASASFPWLRFLLTSVAVVGCIVGAFCFARWRGRGGFTCL